MNRFWMFLILACLAAIFGFVVLTGTPALIGKIAFVVLLILAIVSLLMPGGTP